MKILVTGGAGFIGSHVVDRLIEDSHDVLVLDSLVRGKRPNVHQEAQFIRADIRDRGRIRQVLIKFRPRAILHLAAQINVRDSIERPDEDAEVNILGGLSVLGACLEAGTCRFIFASSGGAIYGEQPSYPCSESALTRPTSPYGIAKLAFEHYLAGEAERRKLDAVSLRLANVYGPRQDPRGEAGVISIFLSRILAGKPPTVFGDGLQTRDYVFVEDVARAFAAALSGPPGTYNVGTGLETDVNQLVDELTRLAGFKGKPIYAAPIPGEVRRNALDASLSHKRLGWFPEVDLKQGLAMSYRSLLGSV